MVLKHLITFTLLVAILCNKLSNCLPHTEVCNLFYCTVKYKIKSKQANSIHIHISVMFYVIIHGV